MKVAHWAGFGPGTAGLYEAARDCARADALAGHEVMFVDTGLPFTNGEIGEKKGGTDARGDWTLTCSPPDAVLDADVWISHCGIEDAYAARSDVPTIFILHGKPLDCFRSEIEMPEKKDTYTLIGLLGDRKIWPRVKKLVTFWHEHVPFWAPIVESGKLVCFDSPPLDIARFTKAGTKFPISNEHNGTCNVLICDSWRPDLDVYEVIHGAALFCERTPGARLHMFGFEPSKLKPWQPIFRYLQRKNIMGDLYPRVQGMDAVFRAMDMIISPTSIANRIVMECQACGVPIVAGPRNAWTPYTANPFYPESVAGAAAQCWHERQNKREEQDRQMAETVAKFSLQLYNERMAKVYAEVCHAN